MKLNIREKLLTKEEEFEIFNKYRLLENAYRKTKDENKKQQIIDVRNKLKNEIFNKNIGLALVMAQRARHKIKEIVETDDLIQYASFGLLNAIDRYDVYSGNRFSTYATKVIETNILRKSLDVSRVVRIPQKVYSEYSTVARKLFQRNTDGECKQIADVADELGKSSEYVASVVNLVKSTETTEEAVIEKENNYLKEFDEHFLAQDITKSLECLNDAERYIIVNYFGLDGHVAMTCDELANILNVTKSAVSARMKHIIEKLKDGKLLTHWRYYEAG